MENTFILKDGDFDSVSGKKDVVSENDIAKLSSSLLKLDDRARLDIIEISSLLNRKNNDNFYIAYYLICAYMNKQKSYINPDTDMENFEKNILLSFSKKVITKNTGNINFITAIYNILRKGSDLDIVFNQNKMIMLLSDSTKMQNSIASKLNEKTK